MNFRILAGSIRPRGQILALLAASALSATLIASGAQAQQPRRPRAPGARACRSESALRRLLPRLPRRRPGRASPSGWRSARRRAQPPEQQVQLIYAPWTKFCLKGQEAGAKQVCFTGKDGRIESGQPVIAAVIIEPEGEPKKLLRVTLPLGMQLVHGTRIIVDSNAPLQGPYVICFQNGCMSDYEATPELIASMKKGQNLVVQAINSNGAPLTLPLPLAGEFAKAYDGPPTDPKVFEENQKKLQEELQKRAEEQRKKLEGAGGARQSGGEVSAASFDKTQKAPEQGAFFVAGEGLLVQRRIARAIAARLVLHEDLGDLRMPDRLAGIVRQQVLFGDIGDVFGLRIFREQVIERLVLVRPNLLGDRQPPFLGIVEFRIDIENHAPE